MGGGGRGERQCGGVLQLFALMKQWMWEGIKATENLPYTSPWNILFRHQVTHNHLLLKASFS